MTPKPIMPKARIFKEQDGWKMSVVFPPPADRVEVYTGFSSFNDVRNGFGVYRATFLKSLVAFTAPSQRGLVH
jgi:hypothetical protein